jgi:uncharacterized lipoprotein YajG
MRTITLWTAIAAVSLLQGCAFTNATLKVTHDANANTQGPISDAGAVKFTPPQIADGRMDKARIGWKKNGYGMNTADIYTAEPVEKIVEKALADAVVDNKHAVGDDGRVRIAGTVDRFWFETDVNFWTVKFIGDVQCTLDFIDTQTNKSIYKSSYSGNHSHETGGGLEKTWTMVMGKALDKMIEDVVLDDDLAQALKGLK